MKRYASFLLAGAIGFAVDAGVLALLTSGLNLDPFLSRAASIAAAMSASWVLNRTLTFGPSGHSLHGEAARYGGVAIAMALFNYTIYSALLLVLPGIPPLAALAAASAAAMAVSYLGYSRLVFTRH